jgi:hypothetical protein
MQDLLSHERTDNVGFEQQSDKLFNMKMSSELKDIFQKTDLRLTFDWLLERQGRKLIDSARCQT